MTTLQSGHVFFIALVEKGILEYNTFAIDTGNRVRYQMEFLYYTSAMKGGPPVSIMFVSAADAADGWADLLVISTCSRAA
jgi:hypothetical protein